LSNLFLKPFGLVYSVCFIISFAERISDVLPECLLLQFKTITAIYLPSVDIENQFITLFSATILHI